MRITLEKVTKYFGKTKAVEDLSLEVEDGEFLVLLGPSGCGKTTTLRMIAGLEAPTSGNIYFDDQLVNNLEPKERKVAMVFQDYALYPHMSASDNITLCLNVMNVPKHEIMMRLKETAELLQINEFLHRKPSELSGGQRQRVALARAVIRKPSIYMLDEPLSNLDALLRIRMRGELKKLHEKLKTTTVYVTHDQAEAMVLADRIAVMKDGLLHQMGKPRGIYDHPVDKFVATFVGMPMMNLITGTLFQKNGRFFLQTDSFTVKIPVATSELKQSLNHEVLLGIRPEHITVDTKELKGSEEARVWLVQHMGDTAYVSFELGSQIITARVDPRFIAEEGERIFVKFDEDFIHIFDKATEKTIQ